MLQINSTQFVGIVAFGSAAMLAGFAARAAPRERRRWIVIAAIHTLFALEVFAMGRHHASAAIGGMLRDIGLYPERRLPQFVLILLIAGLALVASRRLMRGARRRATAVATAATLALVLLFGVESISLHAVDQILYRRIGPLPLIGWLWIAGALTTVIGAVAGLSRQPATGSFTAPSVSRSSGP